jgi:hypothetical protein
VIAAGNWHREPSLSSCLPAKVPVFSLALAARTHLVAVPLASTFNLEKTAALSVCTNSNVARLKEFSSQNSVEQWANSETEI